METPKNTYILICRIEPIACDYLDDTTTEEEGLSVTVQVGFLKILFVFNLALYCKPKLLFIIFFLI